MDIFESNLYSKGKPMPPVLYLIDGHGLAYRAYYALTAGGTRTNAFQTSKGETTQVL